MAVAGLLWPCETCVSGVEHCLGERTSQLGERVSHMEGLSEGLNERVSRIESVPDNYFMQVSKQEESQ